MKLGIAMTRLSWIGSCAMVACVACSGAPTRSENPSDYTDAINCTTACTNLHNLGCESGADVHRCRRFCEKVQKSHYLSLPLNCVVAAKTRQEARLCGTTCSE